MNGDHLERICSCGETETQAVEKVIEKVKDEKTGLSISTEGDTKLPEGTKLVAVEITKTISETESEEVKTAIKVIGEDNELLSIFDISLEFDNSKIQPDGMVKVELPMPKVEEGKEYKSYKVVYIDDDGVAHDMPTEVKDGKIIFTTDHFSRYAIVGVDAPIDNTSSGIPTWAIVLIACAGVIAVAGTAVFLVVKKKKTAK